VIGERQASQCFRFTDEQTYPTGNLAYGTPTPKIFAKNRGQILLTGVDSPGKAAVVEAHGARYNFSRQKVKSNHQDTASDCEVANGEPYSVPDPASIYIQFVRADLEHSEIEPMMAAFSQWTAAMRRKARLAAAAAILQGDEAKSDEQASLEVLAQRKETKKKQRAAAGSAPKRKQVTVRKNHPRFAPGVAYEGFIWFWYRKSDVVPSCTARSQRPSGVIGASEPPAETTGAMRGRRASSGVFKWCCVSHVTPLQFCVFVPKPNENLLGYMRAPDCALPPRGRAHMAMVLAW
jgi:hypothetical protein